MTQETQKACNRCGELIPLSARRCSKCRSWQSFWAYFSGDPQAWLWLPAFLVILLPLYFLWMPKGADFSKYQEQIEVMNARIEVTPASSWRGLKTIGTLHNHSPIKWTDVVIEVQYFDLGGKLVATKTEKNADIVLLPGTDHAFQVSSELEFPAETYASQKVFVRDAREARSWP